MGRQPQGLVVLVLLAVLNGGQVERAGLVESGEQALCLQLVEQVNEAYDGKGRLLAGGSVGHSPQVATGLSWAANGDRQKRN